MTNEPSSVLVSKNFRFLFFVYCCVSKDHPAKFNYADRVECPIEAAVLRSYAEYIKKKFPTLNKETPFEIVSNTVF